ncbi:RICIN domain-containing protein [Lentzea sp. NPDC054927]
MFKKMMIAAATLAMVALPAVASAAPAPVGAQAVAGPYVLQVGTPPGRVLEVLRSQVSTNGGLVRQFDRDGSDEQKWLFFDDRTIRPLLDTTMCLDANPNENWDGGKVWVWKCNGTAFQKWAQAPGLANTLQNEHSLRCLDANPNENWNGGKIWQWRCWGGAPQSWKRIPV